MKIKACIIDDNFKDANILKKYLEELNEGIVISIFNENEIELLLSNEYDLCLLDIDMIKISGIDIAIKLNNVYPNSKIIFVSNREDLVFESNQADSIYFVRKSNILNDLKKAIKKYKIKCYEDNKEIELKYKQTNIKLLLKNIVYIEKYKNDLIIHLSNEKNISFRKSLRDILSILDKNFILVNSNTIVNLRWIDNLNKDCIFINGISNIYISRRKIKEVNTAYLEYLVK